MLFLLSCCFYLVDRAVNILFMRMLGSFYIVNRSHYVQITSHGL